ncbi:MAG: glycosyltransferase family 39 protein [Solirubrobacteraceae bacterium]
MPPAESDSTSTRVRSPPVHDPRDRRGETPADRDGRLWAWCGLALVLCVALGLRLWGIKEGLPYVYNIDEAGHFVPKAVTMFSEGLNPRYFVNPPALTYVLHFVFDAWFGGAHGVRSEYARHPGEVFLVGRVTVALLSTAAVWMLYLLGARLFNRRIGLLAAAIEAVSFLPVSYGHLALNDAVTLLPLTLSLFGSAGVMRYGRKHDYALAGIGLGLACASKYTAGIAIVPLVVAAAAHYLDSIDATRVHPARGQPTGDHAILERPVCRVVLGVALAGVCAFAAFLIANPYSLLDFKLFYSELVHQSSLSDEAQGKLGAPKEIGIFYYLWSFSWGLGWAPALAALGGAITIWRRHPRIGWLLVPAAILFLGFMGVQDRYFGRWLLPIFPIACLLAAYFASRLVRVILEKAMPPVRAGGKRIVVDLKAPEVGDGAPVSSEMSLAPGVPVVGKAPRSSSRRRRLALLAGALIASVLLAQGLVYSVHNDLVLSRADTRNITRAWMVAHVPRGTPIVVEPVVLDSWVEEGAGGSRSDRWQKYQSLQSVIAPDGSLAPQTIHQVTLEDYETTLSPALIGWYEHLGYCWVVVGSTESGRALADPRAAPFASAYYHALATQAEVAYSVSPYSPGSSPTRFSFDWSFDYYPLSYAHPGPEMTVYRLRGGRCAPSR